MRQTPVQLRGYNIGQYFRVIQTCTGMRTLYTSGDIVMLRHDDKSRSPLFRKENGDRVYINLDNVVPYYTDSELLDMI